MRDAANTNTRIEDRGVIIRLDVLFPRPSSTFQGYRVSRRFMCINDLSVIVSCIGARFFPFYIELIIMLVLLYRERYRVPISIRPSTYCPRLTVISDLT